MEIRPCREHDLGLLEAGNPTGRNRDHARRFARQEQGLSTFLIAWADGVLVAKGKSSGPDAPHPK